MITEGKTKKNNDIRLNKAVRIAFETYFENEDNNVNRNEGCCSTLIVLAVIFIIVNVLIV